MSTANSQPSTNSSQPSSNSPMSTAQPSTNSSQQSQSSNSTVNTTLNSTTSQQSSNSTLNSPTSQPPSNSPMSTASSSTNSSQQSSNSTFTSVPQESSNSQLPILSTNSPLPTNSLSHLAINFPISANFPSTPPPPPPSTPPPPPLPSNYLSINSLLSRLPPSTCSSHKLYVIEQEKHKGTQRVLNSLKYDLDNLKKERRKTLIDSICSQFSSQLSVCSDSAHDLLTNYFTIPISLYNDIAFVQETFPNFPIADYRDHADCFGTSDLEIKQLLLGRAELVLLQRRHDIATMAKLIGSTTFWFKLFAEVKWATAIKDRVDATAGINVVLVKELNVVAPGLTKTNSIQLSKAPGKATIRKRASITSCFYLRFYFTAQRVTPLILKPLWIKAKLNSPIPDYFPNCKREVINID